LAARRALGAATDRRPAGASLLMLPFETAGLCRLHTALETDAISFPSHALVFAFYAQQQAIHVHGQEFRAKMKEFF
jgi:hypothetical protein